MNAVSTVLLLVFRQGEGSAEVIEHLQPDLSEIKLRLEYTETKKIITKILQEKYFWVPEGLRDTVL